MQFKIRKMFSGSPYFDGPARIIYILDGVNVRYVKSDLPDEVVITTLKVYEVAQLATDTYEIRQKGGNTDASK